MYICNITCQIALHRILPLVMHSNLHLLLNVPALVYTGHYSRNFNLFNLRFRDTFLFHSQALHLTKTLNSMAWATIFQCVFCRTLVLQGIIEFKGHINTT